MVGQRNRSQVEWSPAHRTEDHGLSASSNAAGSATSCGDLCPCWRATQVAGDGASYADSLGAGSSENVAPLTHRGGSVQGRGNGRHSIAKSRTRRNHSGRGWRDNDGPAMRRYRFAPV